MGFLSDISAIGEAAASFLVALFKTLTEVFLTTTTTGSGETAVTTTGLSFFGQLLLFSSAIGLGIWVVNWIRGLIQLRRD